MGQMAATFFFQLQGANSAEASNPPKSFDQASADSPIFGAVLSASLDNSNTPFAELTPEKLPQTLQELQEEFQGQFKLVSLKKGDVKIDEEGNVLIPKRILNAIEKGEFSEPGNFSTQLSSNAEKAKNTDDMVSISVVSKGKMQQFIKHLNQEAENSSHDTHSSDAQNLLLFNVDKFSIPRQENSIDLSNGEKSNEQSNTLIQELKAILEKAGSSKDVKALLQTLKEIAQSTESRDFMKALQEFSEKHNIDLSTVFRNATKTESDNKILEKKDTQTDSTSSLRSKIQDILTSSKNAPLNSHEKTQITKQEGAEEREKVVSTKNHGKLVEDRKINGDLHEKSRDAQTQISKSSLKEVDIAKQTDTRKRDNPLNQIKDGFIKRELAENRDNDKKDSILERAHKNTQKEDIKQSAEPTKEGKGNKGIYEKNNDNAQSNHQIETTEKSAAIFDETILKTAKGKTHPTNSDKEEQNQEQVSIKRPFLAKEQILAGEKTTNKDASNEKPLGSLSPQAEEVTPNVERKENEKKDHDSQAVKGDRQDIDSHIESIATQDRENGQEKTGLPPNLLGMLQQLILAYQKVENSETESTSGINKDEFLENT
ncbi:hypothetical protein GF373_13715, partial [bacterium]|nr:hypothetical protein [bacterium]